MKRGEIAADRFTRIYRTEMGHTEISESQMNLVRFRSAYEENERGLYRLRSNCVGRDASQLRMCGIGVVTRDSILGATTTARRASQCGSAYLAHPVYKRTARVF